MGINDLAQVVINQTWDESAQEYIVSGEWQGDGHYARATAPCLDQFTDTIAPGVPFMIGNLYLQIVRLYAQPDIWLIHLEEQPHDH